MTFYYHSVACARETSKCWEISAYQEHIFMEHCQKQACGAFLPITWGHLIIPKELQWDFEGMATLLLWSDTLTKVSKGRKGLFQLKVQGYSLSWLCSQDTRCLKAASHLISGIRQKWMYVSAQLTNHCTENGATHSGTLNNLMEIIFHRHSRGWVYSMSSWWY